MQKQASRVVPELFAAALCHHQAGRLVDAERLFREILTIDSRHADSLHLLGVIAHQVGRSDIAVEWIGQAIAINGDAASFHYNLGFAWKALGKLDNAIDSYKTAIRIAPDNAEAYCNLGIVLKERGRYEDAVAAYETALRLKPDYAEAQYNLGNSFYAWRRLDDAVTAYRKALSLKPDYAKAHANLGNTWKDLDRLDDAIASYRAALLFRPDVPEAYYNLGVALYDAGRLRDAVLAYGTAMRIEPNALTYAAHYHLMVPIIPESAQDMADWRDRYGRGIAELAAGNFVGGPDDLNPQSFYLAYSGNNDRDLMVALARMFRQHVPMLTATAPHIARWRAPTTSERRIRVGFLSEHLVTHTIGNLNQGIIRYLDRRRFELVLLHTPSAKQDELSQELNAAADKFLTLPIGLAAQQRAIAAEELDVLFFPDIGMAPSTYFLAYARLAPVQAVTWGHPDTTGLDSMDYFLAPASFEVDGADAHYSETLVRLDRVNCYYEPPDPAPERPSRASLGLPETGTLYGCPQSLFKFHPDFDAVLAAIAEGDPAGHIVLVQGKFRHWSEQLRARWAKSFPILLDRVLFLPKMSRRQFMAQQACMDVLLDPIHFGGGNTFYEAMVYGVPMVTWPSQFLRGRIARGLYQQMGLADAPIVERLEDYAPLALALGRDTERRHRLRESLTVAAVRDLFSDMQAVRAFEAFLDAAVAAAGRGQKFR